MSGTAPSDGPYASQPTRVGDARSTVLFLASSPLHVFFSLGLMAGPFRDAARTLALIDQPPGERDFIADALQAHAPPGLALARFPPVRAGRAGRQLLDEIGAFTAALAPTTIAVGNDRRLEFYAALRACPSARRIYTDDGLYSYLPHRDAQPAWREALSNRRRGWKYGVPLERPSLVGGSRAVQEAYVLLPEQVHAGLAGKPVQGLRPEWFAEPWVREACVAAAGLAGFDAQRCGAIGLLLLLPHPRFLQADPALARRIESLALEHVAHGEVVALKSHPDAASIPVHRQLRLPDTAVLEVPARLPAEVLVPLMKNALVAGTLTTALLSLALLGRQLTVRSLVPRSASGAGQRYNQRALEIYESVGIRRLDGDAGSAS